jgi:dTDP-4-dehydrorhamnose 3,5-epimerase
MDSRGWFSETYRQDKLLELGISCCFVQENRSFSERKGTVRGLHFQTPPAAQTKLVTVLGGRILDVIVDVRSQSPTFGKHVSVELDAESGLQLYVPVGFAHGFATLTDGVLVSYKVSSYYSPQQNAGIRWDDPALKIEWPVNNEAATVSESDQAWPLLKDFESPFAFDGAALQALAPA